MTVFTEIRAHPLRVLKTVSLFSGMLSIGLSLGIVGPTLLDIKTQVQSQLEDVAIALPARAGGYALGSFVMGFVYNRLNMQLTAAICLAICAVFTAFLPFLRELWLLLSVFFVNGCFMGFVGAGMNMFLLHVWGLASGPFMQGLHFCYGLGALIVPSIAKPFLVSKEEDGLILGSGRFTTLSPMTQTTNTSLQNVIDDGQPKPDDLLLHYPYSIVAGQLVFSSLFFLVLYIARPETPAHPSRSSKVSEAKTGANLPEIIEDSEGDALKYNSNRWISKWVFLAACILFMHVYYGLEISFGSFLTTYVFESKGLPIDSDAARKAIGADMTSVYWATFTFLRLLTIFFADYISPDYNIAGCLLVTILSNAILVPNGASSLPYLWAGVALIGAGTSSIWATMFTFIEMYFPVTSGIAAAIIISACFGEFVFPMIISRLIVVDAQIFLWIVLFCTMTISVIFTMTAILGRLRFRKIPYVPGKTMKVIERSASLRSRRH